MPKSVVKPPRSQLKMVFIFMFMTQLGGGSRRSRTTNTFYFSAQLMPNVSYTAVPSEKGKEKASDGK